MIRDVTRPGGIAAAAAGSPSKVGAAEPVAEQPEAASPGHVCRGDGGGGRAAQGPQDFGLPSGLAEDEAGGGGNAVEPLERVPWLPWGLQRRGAGAAETAVGMEASFSWENTESMVVSLRSPWFRPPGRRVRIVLTGCSPTSAARRGPPMSRSVASPPADRSESGAVAASGRFGGEPTVTWSHRRRGWSGPPESAEQVFRRSGIGVGCGESVSARRRRGVAGSNRCRASTASPWSKRLPPKSKPTRVGAR